MKVDKMSISLDAGLAAEVREAARRSGQSLSAWVADAVAEKRRSEALQEVLDEWEAEHGPIPDEELARARNELGRASKSSVA
jgi:hypothetical protein